MTLGPQDCRDLKAEIDELDDEYRQLLDEIEEEQRVLDQFEEARAHVESVDMETQIDELTGFLNERRSVEERKAICVEDAHELSTEISNVEAALPGLESHRDVQCEAYTEAQEKLESLNDKLVELFQEQRTLDQALKVILEEITDPAERGPMIGAVTRRQTLVKHKILIAEGDKSDLMPEFLRLQNACTIARVAVDKLDDRLSELQDQLKWLEKKIQGLDNDLLQLDAEIAARTEIVQAIKEMIERVANWFSDRPVTMEAKQARLEKVRAEYWGKYREYLPHCGHMS